MIKVTDSKLFLDSCIWLGYFLGNIPETKKLIESEETILFTSIISVHEVFKKLRKLGKTEKESIKAIEYIEENGIVITLNKKIVLFAAESCKKYRLHTIDSLIYSSAMETNATFVTVDKDFRKTPNTKMIDTR